MGNALEKITDVDFGGGGGSPLPVLEMFAAAIAVQPAINAAHLAETLQEFASARTLGADDRLQVLRLADVVATIGAAWSSGMKQSAEEE
jgi:hypothetical protein